MNELRFHFRRRGLTENDMLCLTYRPFRGKIFKDGVVECIPSVRSFYCIVLCSISALGFFFRAVDGDGG